MALGGFAFLVSLFIVFAIMAMMGNMGMMNSTRAMTIAATIALCLMILGNMAVWKFMRWRMFVYGYLMSFGILALVFGVCIAILSSL